MDSRARPVPVRILWGRSVAPRAKAGCQYPRRSAAPTASAHPGRRTASRPPVWTSAPWVAATRPPDRRAPTARESSTYLGRWSFLRSCPDCSVGATRLPPVAFTRHHHVPDPTDTTSGEPFSPVTYAGVRSFDPGTASGRVHSRLVGLGPPQCTRVAAAEANTSSFHPDRGRQPPSATGVRARATWRGFRCRRRTTGQEIVCGRPLAADRSMAASSRWWRRAVSKSGRGWRPSAMAWASSR